MAAANDPRSDRSGGAHDRRGGCLRGSESANLHRNQQQAESDDPRPHCELAYLLDLSVGQSFNARGGAQAIVESHHRDRLRQLLLQIQAAGQLDRTTGSQ